MSRISGALPAGTPNYTASGPPITSNAYTYDPSTASPQSRSSAGYTPAGGYTPTGGYAPARVAYNPATAPAAQRQPPTPDKLPAAGVRTPSPEKPSAGAHPHVHVHGFSLSGHQIDRDLDQPATGGYAGRPTGSTRYSSDPHAHVHGFGLGGHVVDRDLVESPAGRRGNGAVVRGQAVSSPGYYQPPPEPVAQHAHNVAARGFGHRVPDAHKYPPQRMEQVKIVKSPPPAGRPTPNYDPQAATGGYFQHPEKQNPIVGYSLAGFPIYRYSSTSH